jgi:hypothetical protein
MSSPFHSVVCAGICLVAVSGCNKLTPVPAVAERGTTENEKPSERYIPVIKLPTSSEDLPAIKNPLTGGSSRTWVLDNTVAATITVGTNAAPASYYAGGALGSLLGCQADDEYTFTNSQSMVYDAKSQTFVAGVFSCQAPRSATVPFTFGPATDGLAQLVLNATATAPLPFIGTTDAAPDRIYRIISINAREMVLRGGGSTADPVFTFKMKVR